jgi:hypothetical protein
MRLDWLNLNAVANLRVVSGRSLPHRQRTGFLLEDSQS